MEKVAKELLDSISQIKGNGTFVTQHSASFVFSGLSIEGLGEIAYPINALQAKAMIKVAQRAPFGKGNQTILDETVRSAWEINAESLVFRGNEWSKFLEKVVHTIKPQLGIEGYDIEASLYKMLIYEQGDFFLAHRDTEKEKGMFGTLIICLPSSHQGGTLLVRFDGEEKSIDLAEAAGNYQIPFVAFYADCEHEVKPLEGGYRVCLVYNLVHKNPKVSIPLESLSEHVARLAGILKGETANEAFSPGIVLLGHQYTPENFTKAQLKLNDRTRAEALIRAANTAGYYAKMCLVTSYLAGTPAYDGYGDDEADEDAEMEDVYDQSISIEHWLEDVIPPLRNMEIQEEHLLTTFELNDGEPIQKESTGYMGNYGPDIMHWYHYGAVVFWPKKAHPELLLQQNTANQLEWVGYYSTLRKQLSKEEEALCETILHSLQSTNESITKPDYNVIVNWLLGYHNEAKFEGVGIRLLADFFLKINEAAWVDLMEAYPVRHFEKIFKEVTEKGSVKVIAHLLAILHRLSQKATGKALLTKQMALLPDYFQTIVSAKPAKPLVNAASFTYLLQLESMVPQDKKWVEQMGNLLSQCDKRDYIHSTLVTTLLMEEKQTPLAKLLLAFAKKYLENKVQKIPKPPANWSRPVPDIPKDAKIWQLLTDFLQSPVDMVFDFRKNQQERDAMESAIQRVKIDLRTETIKKGSPHILRITKTQAAYESKMQEWKEDEQLLKKIG